MRGTFSLKMNIFLNLQIPSSFLKDQSPKRKFEILFCFKFVQATKGKMANLFSSWSKKKLFFQLLLIFQFLGKIFVLCASCCIINKQIFKTHFRLIGNKILRPCATYQRTFLDLGSLNNLAQLAKCRIFSLKNHSILMDI